MRLAVALCALSSCGGFRVVPPDGSSLQLLDAGADVVSNLNLVHEDPGGPALRAVWGSGPNDVYAAGEAGHILAFFDGDTQDAIMGAGNDLYGLWGAGPNEIWAVGTIHDSPKPVAFRKLSDNHWTQLNVTGLHGLRAIWGVGDDRWTAGYDGTIYHGTSTQLFPKGVQMDPPSCAAQTTFAPVGWSIGGNSASNIIVAGDQCEYFRFDGSTWHTDIDHTDETRTFRAAWGPPQDALEIFIGANYYGIWYYTGPEKAVIQYNEEKEAPENVNRYVWGIWGPSRDRVIFVGDGGRIMTFSMADQMVKKVPSPTTRNLYGIWGTSTDDVWIVGEQGTVYHGSIPF